MVLSFAQRGGEPSACERVLAGAMAFYAVKLLEQGIGNRFVAVKQEDLVDLDILEALNVKRAADSGCMQLHHSKFAYAAQTKERASAIVFKYHI